MRGDAPRHVEGNVATPVVVSDEGLSNLSGEWLASRYQLGAVHAHGALCVVYTGQDAVLQRPVAIKVSPSDLSGPYLDALAATGALSYPAYLAIYDVIEQGDYLFICQEYIEGRPLADYLADGAPVRRSVALALQLARAIAYAHQHSLAHGDLTPAAILIDRNAVAHINNLRLPPDWDYFTATAQSAALSGVGADAGETLATLKDDERARDIWSVGAALWALVTRPEGEPAQPGSAAPRAYREDATPETQALIRRALDLTQAGRFASAEELALALEGLDEALAHGATGRHQTIPLAVRAYRDAHEAAAMYGNQPTGIRRMMVSHDDLLNSPTISGVTNPVTIDPSQTRPADDALFGAPLAPQHGQRQYIAPTAPPADRDMWGQRDGPVHNAAYEGPVWQGAYVATQADTSLMRPWVWTLLGIALFLAFFLIGFLAFPQLKLF